MSPANRYPIYWLLVIFACTIATGHAQQPAAPAAGANANPAASPRNVVKLSPKQQITGFYATCKNGQAGKGLHEMLLTNPSVKPENATQVAEGFEKIVAGMGKFLDFNILREFQITERTIIVRCAAHFANQPFVNEFTFYDAGNGEWRLLHLRYDASPATMFDDELRRKETAE